MNLDLDWRVHISLAVPDVVCKIRPLKLWAFQELMAFWQTLPETKDGKPKFSTDASIELVKVAKRVFPEHVKDLQNITLRVDGEQRMATIDDLCDETAFMSLTVEVIGALVSISEMGAEDEKNSEKPQDKSSELVGSGSPAADGSEEGPVPHG